MKFGILLLGVLVYGLFASGEECDRVNRTHLGHVDIQVIIVKGSQWDTPTAQAYIETQLSQAEKILGLQLNAKFIWRDDPDLISDFSCSTGPLIGLFNKYGSPETPTLIFSGTKIPYWKKQFYALGDPISCVAMTIAKPWFGSVVTNEGSAFVLGQEDVNARVVAHEFGHLLGGLAGYYTHAWAWSELMSGYGSGCSISEPWLSAIYKSKYIKTN